ncbi:MAG: FtsX-like permease family protein [Fibrobacter sp.]|nr:FtsX-like permease family protein [Fibrobacter sp.]
MSIFRLIVLAIKAIGRNKFRMFLTMLGIIIGVSSVITMLAIGQGSKQSIQQEIGKMGSNMLTIFSGSNRSGPARGGAGSAQTLTLDDVEAIKSRCPHVAAVSPHVSGGGQVIAGSLNWSTQMHGVDIGYFDVRALTIESGDIFSPKDVQSAAKVCLLGKTVVQNLFPNEDPVGKSVRFKKIPFTVIGVLASKGQSTFGQDQDDLIIAPYTTVQKRIQGGTYLHAIYASAKREKDADIAKSEIEEVLREQHKLLPNAENDFTVRSQQELLTTISSTSKMLTILLASIAGISLVVGGIGIMNIMYVSVTERTREIGLRMAVGARGRDIMMQFLIEALLVSITGGILGLLLGLGASSLIGQILRWPIAVTPYSVILSFVVCAVTGIFFGWYPALKASKLDPIEALRFE